MKMPYLVSNFNLHYTESSRPWPTITVKVEPRATYLAVVSNVTDLQELNL